MLLLDSRDDIKLNARQLKQIPHYIILWLQ